MKRCPECRRDYYDESLLYCLDDGNALLDGPASVDEPETAILPEPPASAGGQFSESATHAQKHTTDATAALPTQIRVSRKNSLIAGVVGILLVTALGLGSYFYYGRGSGSQIESIAVMPFVNEGDNADLEYLSDGMTETLIRSLSKLPNLSVKARSSVFRYKGQVTDARTIGSELGVQAVLNGRVVQRGDQLTLSLELIDAHNENVIWADNYDRKSSEVISLQNDIAKDVSGKLRSKLSGTERQELEKRPTENTEAYRLYLLGRYEWNKRQKTSLLSAVEHFKTAIALDPNFALAHSGLADCYIVFNTYELAPPSEAYALARAAAQKALELDDTHGEAYATLASINDDYDWEFEAAERNYLKAIELSPNYASGHQVYAEYLRMVGRFGEAIDEANRAIDLDPVSVPINLGLGETLYLAGRCDEAIPQFQRTIDLDPGFATAYAELARCYAVKGMYDEAIAESRKAIEQSKSSNASLASLAYALAKAGRAVEGREVLGELEARRKTQFVAGTHLAPVFYALGDINTAFAELERAAKDRSPGVRYIKVDPRYGSDFRSDLRYLELLTKIGLPK